jgi:hypothetical protein
MDVRKEEKNRGRRTLNDVSEDALLTDASGSGIMRRYVSFDGKEDGRDNKENAH